MKIENYKDNKDALRALTRQLMDYMARKEDDEPFNLALSGGETAKQMFALWADEYKIRAPFRKSSRLSRALGNPKINP